VLLAKVVIAKRRVKNRMEDAAGSRHGGWSIWDCFDGLQGLNSRCRYNATNGLGPQWNHLRTVDALRFHASTPVLLRRFSFLHLIGLSAFWLRRKLRRAFTGLRFGSASSSSLIHAPPLLYRTSQGWLLWISSFILFFFAVLALGLISLPLSPRCDARCAYNNLSKAALVA